MSTDNNTHSNTKATSFPKLMGVVQRMLLEIARGFDRSPSLYTYTLFHNLQRQKQDASQINKNKSYNRISSSTNNIRKGLENITTSETLLLWLLHSNRFDFHCAATNLEPSTTTTTTTTTTHTAPFVPMIGLSYFREELLKILLVSKQPESFNTMLVLLFECSEQPGDVWYTIVRDVLVECVRPRVLRNAMDTMHAKMLYEWSIFQYKVLQIKEMNQSQNEKQQQQRFDALAKQTAMLLDLQTKNMG